jgi:nicotinate-nucleotide pyrophosphorylase (carboxylating)
MMNEKTGNEGLNIVFLKRVLKDFLKEDVGIGDITSNLIENKRVNAKIMAKSSGIISGINELKVLFDMVHVDVIASLEDGNSIEKDMTIMNLSGNLREILLVERTALNILMRMSAITTSTADLVAKIKKINSNVRLAATRKTTPGFRWFEKKAVTIGGGDTHRWKLDDMVLIKDTHLDACSHKIPELLKKAKLETSFSKKIEIEVENNEDAIAAASNGADIIMLDNMSPKMVKSVINNIKEYILNNNKPMPLIEVSGNLTDKNIIEYAESGADILSTSQITMFPHLKVDISLKIDLK